MKTYLLATLLAVPRLFAQGDIIPAEPPAPTMKRLDQVEARTIVNMANTPGDAANTFIISAPGSYYFTGNLSGTPGKHGISIQANDVTLDMNGFALISSVGGAFRGVNVPVARENFCIRNGSVRGWSDGGVRADLAENMLAEKLRLSGNTGSIGLAAGNGSMIKDCLAIGNATGFFAADRTHLANCIATANTGAGFACTSFVTLLDCTASRNTTTGFTMLGSCHVMRCSATRNDTIGFNATSGCTFADCTAGSNLHGFKTGNGNTVRSCTASANESRGSDIGSGSTIADCTAFGNLGGPSAYGIDAHSDSTVTRCTVSQTGSVGIFGNSGLTIEACTVTANQGTGIQVVGTNNTIRNCTARGNSVGIAAPGGGCHIVGNTCHGNAGSGISASDGNRIEENSANGNGGSGFSIGAGSFLVRNTARGNGTSYSFTAPIARGNVLNFTGGGNITTPEPWANFEY